MRAILRLEAGDHRVDLDIAGDGRAISWMVGSDELLGARSSNDYEYGMYAMGPWAGRLNGNAVHIDGRNITMPVTYGEWALHGTVVGQRCAVVDERHGAGFAEAVVDLDLGPSWPWPGTLRAHWRLEAECLRTRLELIAHDEPFPGVIGWHPWFRRELRGAAAAWAVDGALLAERDADYRLSGRLMPPDRPAGTYDDAFRGTGAAALSWPGVLDIEIESTAPWFVVFDMLPAVLCVEPQSGPPNGVNDGLGEPIGWARPGQPLVLDTAWRISRAPLRD